MSLKDAMLKMRQEVHLYLFECCREMREYSDTGILCDGDVRRITAILTSNNEHPMNYHDASAIVHSQIKECAMHFVVQNW